MHDRFSIGLLVANRHGVLHRIAGLYNKRGYNIDSLAVGETENPRLSRMTIVSRGDASIQTQMLRQIKKLPDVKAAAVIEGDGTVFVEHLLIKLSVGKVKTVEITALVNQYGGKILDVGSDFLLADITGNPQSVQSFIEKCKAIGIHELCRSGVLALAGGSDKNLYQNEQKEENRKGEKEEEEEEEHYHGKTVL
jgi:acetolactate synthase-1/3 small subunit